MNISRIWNSCSTRRVPLTFFKTKLLPPSCLLQRHYTTVMGIETSCDDTGVAIVDDQGRLLGDALQSQSSIHKPLGWGIHPVTAAQLHERNIHAVVQSALHKSNLKIEDIHTIATTVGPGLAFSLNVGLDYSKKLLQQHNKRFIAVHHMAAHALTVRMLNPIEFPYLVLLVSGGHCILAVVNGPCEFYRLGSTLDDAPGEVFDKVARTLELHTHPEVGDIAGGRAIEIVAKLGDEKAFKLPHIMAGVRNCNFSFAGFKSAVNAHLKRVSFASLSDWDQQKMTIAANMAASFQYYLTWHIAKRVRRALVFCKTFNPKCRTLVISGGVACNNYIRNELDKCATAFGFQLACPPPYLCTDNGIMIAWAGVEHLKSNTATILNPQSVIYQPKWPLGVDLSDRVAKSNIKV
ncbi:uncharacterized protein TRIADDRAFT_21983 [Trichoplax adhaerens]|uniref:N(6)-L-threonylcarbamoyladenine synthase n=1 Tax=Trichoplax adhaerens TaxID=10228 RepID=B3RQR7_TRIAD|nr:hypothetical protein TRIADDRAFT_21983 [Trichoplax adhaerens]EDV27286.1 hypothetical protein TRIADDRAFT_21983 [Trichoplax adhaerens]|eukprot:XP_002111282.1 hypothetical protein TRIADDRAFT_21983 [Trichoplax adhaerens]